MSVGCAQTNAPIDTSTASPETWSDVEETTGDYDEAWATNWPNSVEPIGDGALIIRSLDQGQMLDLAWAQQSSVACFPANLNEEFAGNTLFFALQQPAERSLQVRIESAPNTDSSLWVLQQGANDYYTPPDVPQAIQCESAWRSGTGETETIELSAPDHDYNLLIGVAGRENVDAGLVRLETALD